MLYTINQIKKGDTGGVSDKDLKEYAKKTELDGLVKEEELSTLIDLEGLKASINKKLSIEPQHTHIINDTEQLQAMLNDKLDCKTQYSYKTILSDIEDLEYITNIHCKDIMIGVDKTDGPIYNTKGYSFMVSDSNDLYIMSGLQPIATFNNSSKSWSFNGVNLNEFMKSTSFNEFKNNVEAVLKNHYEAIVALMPDYNDTTPGDDLVN